MINPCRWPFFVGIGRQCGAKTVSHWSITHGWQCRTSLLVLGRFLDRSDGRGFSTNPEQILADFATLDHGRSRRSGFPEAVFAEGKTPRQVAEILDDMARSVNESIAADAHLEKVDCAILATRYEGVRQNAIPDNVIVRKLTAHLSGLVDGCKRN
jgi:hypothetical protein